jgi:hypothetical protein
MIDSLLEDDQENTLDAEETIGQGDESVYLYYNPNDRRLAQLERRGTWECKIGYTAGRANTRLLGQGIRTALSHAPALALVIRSDDGRTLETVLHQSLRLVDSAIVDAGREWFMTSPDRGKLWYAAYMEALEHLRREGDQSTG